MRHCEVVRSFFALRTARNSGNDFFDLDICFDDPRNVV